MGIHMEYINQYIYIMYISYPIHIIYTYIYWLIYAILIAIWIPILEFRSFFASPRRPSAKNPRGKWHYKLTHVFSSFFASPRRPSAKNPGGKWHSKILKVCFWLNMTYFDWQWLKSITSSNDGPQMVPRGPRWSPEVPKTDNFMRPVPKTDNFLAAG